MSLTQIAEFHHQLERSIVPEFCPNEKCALHFRVSPGSFIHYGSKAILRFPFFSPRFQCKLCLKTCSASRFRLHYRQKIYGCNKEIFADFNDGLSRRSSARKLEHSEKMVRGRLIRMARHGLLRHAQLSAKIVIREPLVYDGLENFAFSQYQPNNINHIVGKQSLFIYDFNFFPLNRKGRMSERQKKRLKVLNEKYGIFPHNAIRQTTKRILQRIFSRTPDPVLYSDNHYQYRKVLEYDLSKIKVQHFRVSSKVARNFKNHLFAVNNIDMQARHNLAPFRRETIAFNKHSIAMQESFLLYQLYRNYMRPKFWGTHRSDPDSCKKSPAMEIGITKEILTFEEFFDQPVTKEHVFLNEDQENLYHRRDPLSRQSIRSIA